MCQNADKEKHSQHLGVKRIIGMLESFLIPFSQMYPTPPNRTQSCHISLKAHWPQEALELPAHEKRGCPSGLKDFLVQETWALPSYHLLNPWMGCASIHSLSPAYTGEIGCSELHHSSGIWKSPGPGLGKSRTNHQKQHLRGCSAPSQFTQTWTLLDWPPLCQWDWISDWGLATCTADVFGPTHCLIELTEEFSQMVHLLIQTWLSWPVMDSAAEIVGGLWSGANDASCPACGAVTSPPL